MNLNETVTTEHGMLMNNGPQALNAALSRSFDATLGSAVTMMGQNLNAIGDPVKFVIFEGVKDGSHYTYAPNAEWLRALNEDYADLFGKGEDEDECVAIMQHLVMCPNCSAELKKDSGIERFTRVNLIVTGDAQVFGMNFETREEMEAWLKEHEGKSEEEMRVILQEKAQQTENLWVTSFDVPASFEGDEPLHSEGKEGRILKGDKGVYVHAHGKVTESSQFITDLILRNLAEGAGVKPSGEELKVLPHHIVPGNGTKH